MLAIIKTADLSNVILAIYSVTYMKVTRAFISLISIYVLQQDSVHDETTSTGIKNQYRLFLPFQRNKTKNLHSVA